MINGIKALRFGVEDLGKCQNFATDFGLKQVDSDLDDTTKFSMDNGSVIYVYHKNDTRLPLAFEEGPTLREVTWAVNRQEDFDKLKESLKDVDGYREEENVLYCRDPNGLTLSFEVSVLKTNLAKVSVGINQYGSINRINQASPVYEKASPLGVGHVVLFSPNLAESQKFYEEKLGFYLSDAYNDRGAFLRCSAEGWHHNLFLLKLPNKKAPGLNHVAFIVRDIHEVIGGGLNMNRKKWDSFIGPGRHPVSSAYFWYVHSPFGGAFEYYTNDDYLTTEWQPRHYDYSLDLFTEWAVEGGIDDATRRQINNM